MRQRNYKCFILCVLALFGGGFFLSLAGCSDDPENSDAKQIRQQTADALEMSARGADYDTLVAAQNKVQSSIVSHKKAGKATIDAARLASGNLGMVRGRQLQSGLDLKMLPLRQSIDAFEGILRTSGDLLLEKERIGALLAAGQQETVELEQLLKGHDQQAGLKAQFDSTQVELNQLLAQRQQQQAEKDKVQVILDDHQNRADVLMRKAELAKGDEKLKLEKEAFAILQDRKEYYIQAQASENEISAMSGQIELIQTCLDGLNQSIQETEQRINEIGSSPTRIALKQQMREIDQTLGDNQQQLVGSADAIKTAFGAYGKDCRDTCDIFEEAAAEFEKIGSRDMAFTANLQLAESYHHAALTCSALIGAQVNTTDRLQDLLEMANQTIAEVSQGMLPIAMLQEKLTAAMAIDAEQSQKAMDLFDKAIDTYEQAFNSTASMTRDLKQENKQKSQEAKCSVLKSQLLALDSKVKLADVLGLSEIADLANAKIQELMQQGEEYGVSFTQSETIKLLEVGIDYTASLPINLDVFFDDLQKRFIAWKRLSVDEKEAAVQANLIEIDALISRYGEALALKLEPLKQEMLDAQERGFEEIAPETTPTRTGGGFGEPNGFGF